MVLVDGILLEHVHGEKFLYRSVHAAFVNRKWYEAWLERILLLDSIIFDMWSPGVLSWAPGEHCNSHHARHTGQDTLVVPHLRCGSFLYHKSVGGRGCGQQPDAFFSSPELPRRRANSWLESAFITHFGCVSRHRFVCFPQSLVIACVFSQSLVIALCFFLVFSRVSSLLVYFRRVSSLLCVSVEYRHCFVFLFGFSCQQTQDELAFFLVLSVCVVEFWATWSA